METIRAGDALVIADIQNDFLPGGALGIDGGDKIVPIVQAYLSRFEAHRLPIFLSRDWHPSNHCSFRAQGGPWPVHCVAASPGSLPPAGFRVPESTVLIFKATEADQEAYSAFHGTTLDNLLRAAGVKRLFIGGLATDYCVLNTVKDALANGYDVRLLTDAICAVNVRPDDGPHALQEMERLGAVPTRLDEIAE